MEEKLRKELEPLINKALATMELPPQELNDKLMLLAIKAKLEDVDAIAELLVITRIIKIKEIEE